MTTEDIDFARWDEIKRNPHARRYCERCPLCDCARPYSGVCECIDESRRRAISIARNEVIVAARNLYKTKLVTAVDAVYKAVHALDEAEKS